MTHNADVIIIGAGAAGLATSIFLGRQSQHKRIVALDGAKRIGAKILVSGGGRCNVTNAQVRPADFFGGNRNVLKRVFKAFSAKATREFFSDINVPLHEEDNGKMFPDSNKAQTVVDALVSEAQRVNIELLAQQRVTSVSYTGTHYTLDVQTPTDTAIWQAPILVLATGGLSLPKTGSDGFGHRIARELGHTIAPTTPALDPILLDGDFHPQLSGIAQDVELTLTSNNAKPVRIQGPMLWTHFGISGPAALDISRFWHEAVRENRNPKLTVNLVKGQTFDSLERAVIDACSVQPKAQIVTILKRWLTTRVAEAVCGELDIRATFEAGQLSRDNRRKLIHGLTQWPLPVTATRGYSHAEVTAGGVVLSEIDPSTMASRVCPGLYFVGELLDVDGRIGGFNFQWAWSSSHVAATAIARQLANE